MEECCHCKKPKALCVCENSVPADNRYEVLILQHPQEPDKELGTALMMTRLLTRCTLKTALSVPNLKAAVGHDVDPARWLVLYLGSRYRFRRLKRKQDQSVLYVFNRKGEEIVWQSNEIDGIVAIDGTWAQAKALWWRNPWLLKLKRAVVHPRAASLYGNLRREPRRECLSTIEAVARVLEILGEPPDVTQPLLQAFKDLTTKYREYVKMAAATKGLSVKEMS